MPPKQPFDWNQFYADEHPASRAVDSRARLRICLAGFIVLLLIVAVRTVHLEVTQGEAFRAEAARPLVRYHDLPGTRGRILAADGSVLTHDEKIHSLAVQYRYLEEPPNPRWLRSMVAARLSRAERMDELRVAAEEVLVLEERRQLAPRLAELCGMTPAEWELNARRIQARVERISQNVNSRQREKLRHRREEKHSRDFSPLDVLQDNDEDIQPRRITVREELESHVMAENISEVAAIETRLNALRYPGVSIVEQHRRAYPRGSLAAHILGYLGDLRREEIEADAARPQGRLYHGEDRRGRAGLELRYEKLLHGRRGELIETTDQGGRVLSSQSSLPPGVGRDLVLTIKPRLQETAQRLLDDALSRRKVAAAKPRLAGGAIVVLDARTGAVLAAASAPSFDPNHFSGGKAHQVEMLLNDPARPLFDRATKMAIAPGSVFKIVTAAALLQEGKIAADEPFECRGYLKSPERLRCAIYRRRGVGHGQITLTDALAQSCNVYFFHHVAALDPDKLADWAERFGLGRRTSVDLPGEAAGLLPRPDTIEDIESSTTRQRPPWHAGDSQMLAIGQGSLTATPMQIARLVAAVANGGRLVTPHLVSRLSKPVLDSSEDGQTEKPFQLPPATEISGLSPDTLSAIRRGMRAAVEHEKGTAHAILADGGVTVACKTGTAQTGGDRWDHAWVAGYAPADKPRYAFVVVIQHAGNGSEAACPVAKRLLIRMQQLGLL
ncbi:MAG: penicillin-binding transpeptidase domain-containing protein [Planctomycetota bacterium]|nr:penicillin-binding transpeptidase domain-containing protein [Planctomycetota bacterium]